MDVLKIAIGDASLFDADEQRWLIDALLCVHFALLNTFGNDGGMGNELEQQILTSVHSPSVLLASLPLRMRAVETRNVLLAGPSAAVGAERLNQVVTFGLIRRVMIGLLLLESRNCQE
uniref:Uncharacterized protein n=1 Tax=Globodera pallida TaxID=36090 RepID=A0A183CKI4_GLOPA